MDFKNNNNKKSWKIVFFQKELIIVRSKFQSKTINNHSRQKNIDRVLLKTDLKDIDIAGAVLGFCRIWIQNKRIKLSKTVAKPDNWPFIYVGRGAPSNIYKRSVVRFCDRFWQFDSFVLDPDSAKAEDGASDVDVF